ncbi:hypothetical protein [Deinococcus arcticus]|uniref:Uncharacterized protein n=1 Tax=Deinococcus arcticus TaxID=2136176 RepID=A0A2T3W9R5_9DEIO|nr:hypothetical protein [Deinococcus arcticus]PTA68636.1 hypothetical protein C8263_05115 [Deinococcus arcticus]
MLTLQGQYTVAANKRLTIIADPQKLAKGTLVSDLDALVRACAENRGQCMVQISTPYGLMQGTLTEKSPHKLRMRLFEGHLSFLPRA